MKNAEEEKRDKKKMRDKRKKARDNKKRKESKQQATDGGAPLFLSSARLKKNKTKQ